MRFNEAVAYSTHGHLNKNRFFVENLFQPHNAFTTFSKVKLRMRLDKLVKFSKCKLSHIIDQNISKIKK